MGVVRERRVPDLINVGLEGRAEHAACGGVSLNEFPKVAVLGRLRAPVGNLSNLIRPVMEDRDGRVVSLRRTRLESIDDVLDDAFLVLAQNHRLAILLYRM